MDKPVFVLQWHITHACNLRCRHCYQAEYQSHMPREQLFAALAGFDELIAARQMRGQINLTGGEPLLHPAFFELAEAIRQRDYRLGVLTNGTLIDRDMAARLAALRPVFVQVSLDGPRPQHDAIRGAGAFNRALAGIDRLKEQGVKVLASFTAQKSNAASLGALERVCREHGVDKLWWDRVVTETPEQTRELAVTTGQFRRLVGQTNRLRRLELRRDGRAMLSNSRALQFGRDLCEPGYRCAAGRDLLILLADGGLMPCRRLPFVIGNVNRGSLRGQIEASHLMRELSRPVLPEGCAGCAQLSRCGGGSRCVTYAQTGRLDVRDVNCFYRRR